jgi:hypothetical protein
MISLESLWMIIVMHGITMEPMHTSKCSSLTHYYVYPYAPNNAELFNQTI